MTDIPPASRPPVFDVLIVEDEVSLSDVMTSFLARRGLAVRAAPSASVALGLLEKVRPRVAVLDYHLPGQTGVELAERMRERLPDLPIILMSGDLGGLEKQTLEKIGIKVFVNKPVPLAALHRAILHLISRRG